MFQERFGSNPQSMKEIRTIGIGFGRQRPCHEPRDQAAIAQARMGTAEHLQVAAGPLGLDDKAQGRALLQGLGQSHDMPGQCGKFMGKWSDPHVAQAAMSMRRNGPDPKRCEICATAIAKAPPTPSAICAAAG
jgi:hypothetical protein